MKIYVRTEEGQAAAYNPQSALPRKLKSILKVIDGKTRSPVYEKNLHSFGDVNGLLRSLEIAGLLKEVFDETLKGQPVAELFAVESSQRLETRDWLATRHPHEMYSEQGFTQTSPFRHSLPGSTLRDADNNARADAKKDAVLKATLDEMANFVLLQMPEQSFQVLKEIEEITSLEVLAATLGGYEQMLSGAGPSAAEHLRRIKSVLREHL